MSENFEIKITRDETNNSKVDRILKMEKEMRRPVPREASESDDQPFFYNPIFYYLVAGFVGSILSWAIIEFGFISSDEDKSLGLILLFPIVGSITGLFLGMTEGLVAKNISKGVKCGLVGFGVGLAGGGVGIFLGGYIFNIMMRLSASFISDPTVFKKPDFNVMDLNPFVLFTLIAGRAMAWSIVGGAMSIGQGVATKSKKILMNGLVGGLIGGFLGGMAFDPISFILSGGALKGVTGVWSRMIGICIIGSMTGIFIGLVENVTKQAWLLVKSGPLKGKQFVLYNNVTVIGSSPKCDLYLFKDPKIEPMHATINMAGKRFEIKDNNSPEGVFVNGTRIKTKILEPSDIVVLGSVTLKYFEKK